jgi:hypothetical protein
MSFFSGLNCIAQMVPRVKRKRTRGRWLLQLVAAHLADPCVAKNWRESGGAFPSKGSAHCCLQRLWKTARQPHSKRDGPHRQARNASSKSRLRLDELR